MLFPVLYAAAALTAKALVDFFHIFAAVLMSATWRMRNDFRATARTL